MESIAIQSEEPTSIHFEKIYLEISNICNLKCSFCPPVKRADASLKPDLFREYLEAIKGFSKRVCLHVMGEPLNHSSFPHFVEMAHELGISLEITTNGTRLNDLTVNALLSPAVVQVNFSVQSFFDNFPKADPKTYFRKIFEFSEKVKRQRQDLYVNFRLWNLREDSVDEEKNMFFINELENFFEIKINKTVDPAFRKSKKISGHFYLHFDSRFEWPEESTLEPRTRGTCHGTRSHIAIHANGDVVPCCLDKEARIRLGNLSQSSLPEIVNSERFQKMKAGFENGQLVESFCQTCQYSTRFQKVSRKSN